MGRGERRRGVLVIAVSASVVVSALVALGCGETRRPIGDECLRSEDCLSGVCASRTCVSAPILVTGAGAPPDETPRIPAGDASSDAPADAPADG